MAAPLDVGATGGRGEATLKGTPTPACRPRKGRWPGGPGPWTGVCRARRAAPPIPLGLFPWHPLSPSQFLSPWPPPAAPPGPPPPVLSPLQPRGDRAHLGTAPDSRPPHRGGLSCGHCGVRRAGPCHLQTVGPACACHPSGPQGDFSKRAPGWQGHCVGPGTGWTLSTRLPVLPRRPARRPASWGLRRCPGASFHSPPHPFCLTLPADPLWSPLHLWSWTGPVSFGKSFLNSNLLPLPRPGLFPAALQLVPWGKGVGGLYGNPRGQWPAPHLHTDGLICIQTGLICICSVGLWEHIPQRPSAPPWHRSAHPWLLSSPT